MKSFATFPLLLALACPLLASCESVVSTIPAAPAWLAAPGAQCHAQLNDAARELTGKTLSLTDDAFTKTDAVVLATVGQSAGGRMLPPTMILQLRLTAQGCQLQLDGHDRVIVLPGCACRAQSSYRR